MKVSYLLLFLLEIFTVNTMGFVRYGPLPDGPYRSLPRTDVSCSSRGGSSLAAVTAAMGTPEYPVFDPTRAEVVNIKLEEVKNMRDISTANQQLIKPGLVYRTGCLSKCSPSDMEFVLSKIKFRSLIDLRSERELKEDEALDGEVYNDFHDYRYDDRSKTFSPAAAYMGDTHKKRFFISLMSESLIKKGVFFRLRKRIRAKAIAYAVLSAFSRRMKRKMRNIFISRINVGGLGLLNELVIDQSGPELVSVLKIIADTQNHPVAVYCTAGKDRTGLIAMLVLSVLGMSDDEILADYVLSDAAYRDINDKKAMVASLSQADVDPETFLRAKPEVMEATMEYIRATYGSIRQYLELHGFDNSWRQKLRDALLL